MKRVYLAALLLASIAFSGCAQLNPEGTAIAIADQLPEVRLISKVVDSMQRADQCTFDKFYTGYKKMAETMGTEVPEPTEEQRQQTEAMIQQMGVLAKRCQVRLSKSAEKESENVYMIHYGFETIDDPECNMLSAGDAQVKVDLSTGKAETVSGGSPSSQDLAQYEQAFNELGECAAITMLGFASSGGPSGATAPTTAGSGVGMTVRKLATCPDSLPQDDKDKCIRAMVVVQGEPASRCNEISDEDIKADCIANAPADGGAVGTEKTTTTVSPEGIETATIVSPEGDVTVTTVNPEGAIISSTTKAS